MKIDPITMEVVRHGLVMACEEMKITIERTAYSPVLFEILDFCCGIFDGEANMVAENAGAPIFLANLGETINDTYEVIGRENLEPEDVIFCNDPYMGGSHPNDVTVLYPLFRKNEILAWTVFRGHLYDMGGKSATGFNIDSTEIFQEGLRVPPVKLYTRGKPNRDVMNIIKLNNRIPGEVSGDIRAMVAAVRTGTTHVTKILDRYGPETYVRCTKELMNVSERMARDAVRRIPEGTYKAECYLDGTPLPVLDERIPLKVTVKVRGDEMTIDFTGTAPQSVGASNCPRGTVVSAARFGFKCVTEPLLHPSNEGFFRPLSVVIPKGSLLDPAPPAPCCLWPLSVTTIPDLVLKALSPAIPDKIMAGHFAGPYASFSYGKRPENGRDYVEMNVLGGGWGAKQSEDGEPGLLSMVDGETYNTPVEVSEVRYPHMFGCIESVQDSGGPGKYRGGPGLRNLYRPRVDVHVVLLNDRTKYSPPWGLFGGKDGVGGMFRIHRKDGSKEEYYKGMQIPMHIGDFLEFTTGGGGGYGDPLERDLELVRRDVLNEYVSVKGARKDYGVVMDPKTLEIDEEATKKLRDKLKRQQR